MNDLPTAPSKRKVRVGGRVGSGSVGNTVCITNGTDVKKVKRQVASELVTKGYNYCPRSLWKKEVRDQGTYVAPVAEQQEPSKKAKKVKADKPRKRKS